jgi:raffinose/stachyose/melibiose transport system permease protein
MLASFGAWGGDCTLGPQWLFNTEGYIILPIWVVSFVALWQYVGQSMMLYMAQISGISSDIYEASYIDGCSKKQSFFYITLPLIKPMVATAMSLNAIGSLKFFDLIYNMIPEGFLSHKADVIATHLYTSAFKFRKLGYGSAIGVILLILCLIMTVIINKFVKTESYDY